MQMAIDKGSRVQWTLSDNITTYQGYCIDSPDYSIIRGGTILVAIDPDPNGVDQVQKSVRAVACVDIAILTQIPIGAPNL
jgi:hypothetical protein